MWLCVISLTVLLLGLCVPKLLSRALFFCCGLCWRSNHYC